MGWDQWRRGHCHHPLRPSDLQVLPAAEVVFLKCRLHRILRLAFTFKINLNYRPFSSPPPRASRTRLHAIARLRRKCPFPSLHLENSAFKTQLALSLPL